MSQDKKGGLKKTFYIVLSVVVIYFAVIVLNNLFNFEMPDYSATFLSLIPFIVYLVMSGKISEFRGGGFTLKFDKASEASVVFKPEEVVYADEEVIIKDQVTLLYQSILPEIAENPRSTLKLERRLAGHYTYPALKVYLEELTKFDNFKYVLFVEEGDLFRGYMQARSLLGQFSNESNGKRIVNNINQWDLDKIPGISHYSIKNYQSNKEALNIMENEQISELAVVDKGMRFKGFTNREIITGRILNNLMIKRN